MIMDYLMMFNPWLASMMMWQMLLAPPVKQECVVLKFEKPKLKNWREE